MPLVSDSSRGCRSSIAGGGLLDCLSLVQCQCGFVQEQSMTLSTTVNCTRESYIVISCGRKIARKVSNQMWQN